MARVAAALPALGVGGDFGLRRGAVIVDVGIQERHIELIEWRGLRRIDVRPAHVFAHDGGVFSFHQAGAAGAALSLLDS